MTLETILHTKKGETVYFDIQNQTIPNNFNPNVYTREYNYILQRKERRKKEISNSLLQKNTQNTLDAFILS